MWHDTSCRTRLWSHLLEVPQPRVRRTRSSDHCAIHASACRYTRMVNASWMNASQCDSHINTDLREKPRDRQRKNNGDASFAIRRQELEERDNLLDRDCRQEAAQ
eukprot:GHVU01039353.1.p5 GENE.GHVU01039353.1~~GHVU01039353.1.p5  ORF type:complete len:105 (-),score=6.78 GHVU01039353.1:2609-2923(-)